MTHMFEVTGLKETASGGLDQYMYRVDEHHTMIDDKTPPLQHKMQPIVSQTSRDYDRGSRTWEIFRILACGHTTTHIMETAPGGQANYDEKMSNGGRGKCKECAKLD